MTLSAVLTTTTILALTSTTSIFAIDYGVDVSFPIHREKVSTNYAWLPHNVDPVNNPTPPEYEGMPIQYFADRQKFYDEFLQGCVDFYGKRGNSCIFTEKERVAMSLRQPKSMVNYTDTGFKKIKAPPAVWKLIKEFWDINKDNQKKENWGTGNTYTNNWSSPTKMVSVEDGTLRGGGFKLKNAIWNAARDTLQEWTGEELRECSLYGIRVYPGGSILSTHVDRLPLVSSAIINVAQDVDEPWPIEVIGHDGRAHNVTMEPGEMVLYESHSVLHGRPFPLKGRYYANIFIHFEPVGHTLRHHGYDPHEDGQTVDKKYKEAARNGHGGHEHHVDGMPSYILSESEEGDRWRRQHPDGTRSDRSKPAKFSTGTTSAHQAAIKGDVAFLRKLAAKDAAALHKKDNNGWTPLHEAARGGHTDVINLLIEHGVNVNDRTNQDMGGSALWWVEKTHGKNHPASQVLRKAGALSIEPEL